MNSKFLVIGDFATQGLRGIFLSEKADSGFLMNARETLCKWDSKVHVDIEWFLDRKTNVSDGSVPEDGSKRNDADNKQSLHVKEKFIPLVLCEDRESLKRKGVVCPYEFIIERRDMFPLVSEDGECISEPCETLAQRMSTLLMLYRDKPAGYFFNALKDWFAGAFRMFLMLDSTTHGTSQYIDLELVKKEKCEDTILKALSASKWDNENAKKLYDRFVGSGDEEVKDYLELAKVLYSEYFDKWGDGEKQHSKKIGRSIKRILTWEGQGAEEKLKAFRRIYIDSDKLFVKGNETPLGHDKRLPLSFGERARYVTPSGKLNLLLIDDKVDESPLSHLVESNGYDKFRSSISKDDWNLLRDTFNVQTLPINRGVGDIYELAARCFRRFQKVGFTYDLILVDLCLGNNRRGDDLDGYSMIKIVKEFFPGTPIVVYSRFSDMEHISRAFFNGAKWFLVKGEEAKLPRHALKLLKHVGWHREWRAIENGINKPEWEGERESSFFRKFKRLREWQYLTYKSLESFSGHIISVKKMGGGISSAVTFKATKGVRLGNDFLQTPSIIKIDSSYNTMMEFERYFRMIRPYIANESGRVEMPERVLNRTYSSIVYTFAGKQDKAHALESMGDMLDDDVGSQTACDYEVYRYALQCVFDEILPKIHHVSPELELGDIGTARVFPHEVKDAFEWEAVYAQNNDTHLKTSFPNAYFGEFKPTDFWKSYMLRMQPWRRIKVTIPIGTSGALPFVQQGVCDLSVVNSQDDKSDEKVLLKADEWVDKIKANTQRLIFHNVMLDPFAAKTDVKQSRVAGQIIIEAYTSDMNLVWLEGDACDFVARYRKHVSPGTSLWLGNFKGIIDGKLPKLSRVEIDGRIQWLEDTFQYKNKKNQTAKDDFILSISRLLGLDYILNPNLGFYTKLQDAVIGLAQKAVSKAKEWGMKCPIGIVHGDLNVKNIMLESRKHAPKDDDLDVTKTVSDVWLIDFARTRRDIIAHDFNVFFTSVLGELFTEGLIGKEGKEQSTHQKDYWDKLVTKFRIIVTAAVAPESKNEKGVPDEIKDDRRFTLIYRILRRTHDAARGAGVSQNMYLLTTALACLYTLKIFLNNGCKVRLAAGYFSAAWICYDLLCEAIGETNKMKEIKEQFKQKP